MDEIPASVSQAPNAIVAKIEILLTRDGNIHFRTGLQDPIVIRGFLETGRKVFEATYDEQARQVAQQAQQRIVTDVPIVDPSALRTRGQ